MTANDPIRRRCADRGVGKPQSLTAADMWFIREWVRQRDELGSVQTLAEKFGVSKSTITKAIAEVQGGPRMYKRELE